MSFTRSKNLRFFGLTGIMSNGSDTADSGIDPAVEIDFYGLGCDQLDKIISYIQGQLSTIKSGAMSSYYSNKLVQAQSAKAANCGVKIDCLIPPCPQDPPVKDPPILPVLDPPKLPSISLPPGSTVSVGPPAASGSGGGSGATSASKSKKTLWWLLGLVVIGVCVYNTYDK